MNFDKEKTIWVVIKDGPTIEIIPEQNWSVDVRGFNYTQGDLIYFMPWSSIHQLYQRKKIVPDNRRYPKSPGFNNYGDII